MSHHKQRQLERDERRAQRDNDDVQLPEEAEDVRVISDIREDKVEAEDDTLITPDMSPEEIEIRVRRRVEKRHKAISSFVSNLLAYLTVNALMWIIFGVHGFPWPLFVTVGWGFGVVTQGYQLYQNSPTIVARRENAIRREVERMKAQMGLDPSSYYAEKPKNSEKLRQDQSAVRLTDDGEIVPTQVESESELTAEPRYLNVQRGQSNQR